MHHINFRKAGDGSGRDMYIVKEHMVENGKQNVVFVNRSLPFKHLDLRGAVAKDPAPRPAAKGKVPSHRRGGKGWQPSLHNEDYRRIKEAGMHTAGGAAGASAALPSVSSEATSKAALHMCLNQVNQALQHLQRA
ncbi:unnamed protein product [Symbiodinium sp. CCMP2592]|nr:unnamed protein product [Symbiodinium sp. CCMP2592]